MTERIFFTAFSSSSFPFYILLWINGDLLYHIIYIHVKKTTAEYAKKQNLCG